jgi:hypothetical protein
LLRLTRSSRRRCTRRSNEIDGIHQGPLPQGGEGMRVSGSERWCSLTHKAAFFGQREETPHQPPAPYSRGARKCAPHQFSSRGGVESRHAIRLEHGASCASAVVRDHEPSRFMADTSKGNRIAGVAPGPRDSIHQCRRSLLHKPSTGLWGRAGSVGASI